MSSRRRAEHPADMTAFSARVTSACVSACRSSDGGVRASCGSASTALIDAQNLNDEKYRGISWGIDAPCRGIAVRYVAPSSAKRGQHPRHKALSSSTAVGGPRA